MHNLIQKVTHLQIHLDLSFSLLSLNLQIGLSGFLNKVSGKIVKPHVKCYIGTSSEALKTVSPPLNDPALYADKCVHDNGKLRILNEKWVPPTNFSFPVIAG